MKAWDHLMLLKRVTLMDATFYPSSPRKTLASIETMGCQPSMKKPQAIEKIKEELSGQRFEDHGRSKH